MQPGMLGYIQDNAYWAMGYDKAVATRTITQPRQVVNKEGELRNPPGIVGPIKETKDTYTINGKVVSYEEFKRRVGETPRSDNPLRFPDYEVKGEIDPNTGVADVAATAHAVYHISRGSFCTLL